MRFFSVKMDGFRPAVVEGVFVDELQRKNQASAARVAIDAFGFLDRPASTN